MTPQEIDYAREITARALVTADAAMRRHPQPNYTLTKIAEEAGEVIKAGVHLAEGRDFTWSDLEDECVHTMAMCLRLLIEGDAVIGIVPPHRQASER